VLGVVHVKSSVAGARVLIDGKYVGDASDTPLDVEADVGPRAVHVVASVLPDADIVLLDTGYLFAETAWYAERLRREYGLNLRIVEPLPDAVPDQWMTDTDACCAARPSSPVRK